MMICNQSGNVLMDGRPLITRHEDGSVTITPDDDGAHKQLRVSFTAAEFAMLLRDEVRHD